MDLSIAEIFLGVWAVSATYLWQREKYKFERFMQMTVVQLRKLASGKSKVLDTGFSVEIFDIEENKNGDR